RKGMAHLPSRTGALGHALLGLADAAPTRAGPGPRGRIAHPRLRRGVPGADRARRGNPARECPLPASPAVERSAPVAIGARPLCPRVEDVQRPATLTWGRAPQGRGAARSLEVSKDQKGPDKGFGRKKPRATFGDAMLGIPAGRGGEQGERPKGEPRREKPGAACGGRAPACRPASPRATQARAPEAPGTP